MLIRSVVETQLFLSIEKICITFKNTFVIFYLKVVDKNILWKSDINLNRKKLFNEKYSTSVLKINKILGYIFFGFILSTLAAKPYVKICEHFDHFKTNKKYAMKNIGYTVKLDCNDFSCNKHSILKKINFNLKCLFYYKNQYGSNNPRLQWISTNHEMFVIIEICSGIDCKTRLTPGWLLPSWRMGLLPESGIMHSG